MPCCNSNVQFMAAHLPEAWMSIWFCFRNKQQLYHVLSSYLRWYTLYLATSCAQFEYILYLWAKIQLVTFFNVFITKIQQAKICFIYLACGKLFDNRFAIDFTLECIIHVFFNNTYCSLYLIYIFSIHDQGDWSHILHWAWSFTCFPPNIGARVRLSCVGIKKYSNSVNFL